MVRISNFTHSNLTIGQQQRAWSSANSICSMKRALGVLDVKYAEYQFFAANADAITPPGPRPAVYLSPITRISHTLHSIPPPPPKHPSYLNHPRTNSRGTIFTIAYRLGKIILVGTLGVSRTLRFSVTGPISLDDIGGVDGFFFVTFYMGREIILASRLSVRRYVQMTTTTTTR